MPAVVLAILLGSASVASASDSPTAEAKVHAEKGAKHYALAEFEEAIAELKTAYRLAPRPGLLFNLAQCYAQVGDWDRAAFSYRAYLRDAPKAPNRALVEELIAEAEERAATARAAPSPLWISAVAVGATTSAAAVLTGATALGIEAYLRTPAAPEDSAELVASARTLWVVAGVAAVTSVSAFVVATVTGAVE